MQEVPAVISAADMQDENFLRHFEARHHDQLPGISGFLDTIGLQPELIETYRTFHNRLHELHQIKEKHEHES